MIWFLDPVNGSDDNDGRMPYALDLSVLAVHTLVVSDGAFNSSLATVNEELSTVSVGDILYVSSETAEAASWFTVTAKSTGAPYNVYLSHLQSAVGTWDIDGFADAMASSGAFKTVAKMYSVSSPEDLAYLVAEDGSLSLISATQPSPVKEFNMGAKNIQRQWQAACEPITVAAYGSTYADATQIPHNAIVVNVTGADATTGVALPKAQPGKVMFIKNAAAAALKVYNCDGDGALINTTTAQTAYSMAASASSVFFCTTATQRGTVPLVSS
jgi:hypothetical protein